MVPEPDGLTFEGWVSRLRDEFTDDDIPFNVPEEQWVEWAMRLQMTNTFAELPLDPRGFTGWPDFARRLKQVLGD